jgi:hypothetical protein
MQETSSILSPKDKCKRTALSSLQETDARDQLSPQDRCKISALSSLHRTDARDQLALQDRCKRPALSTGQMQETSSLLTDR